MNLLEIKNLNFGFKNQPLLYKDFNLAIKQGELISIVGASGSGKSTLFNIITNEIKIDNNIIINGNISQIYQDPYSSFHHTYSIINQITDVTIFDKNELIKMCKLLDIKPSLLEQKPFKLSGGQLQRCSILRALLMKPKLLLADEPISALDNITALSIMKILISQLDKLAILLITHDIQLANWCSDKIVQIDNKSRFL